MSIKVRTKVIPPANLENSESNNVQTKESNEEIYAIITLTISTY